MDKIQPVDDLVRAGFQQKVVEQFRCPAHYTTSPDKLASLKTLLGNEQPQYPYLFMTVQSGAPNVDWYTSRRLARYGVPVTMSDDKKQMFYARLLPHNFEMELTFVTNKYSGGLESVEGFQRRWMFGRRNGFLQYRINYGLTALDIAVVLNDTVSLPLRENPAEQESVYQVVATATVKGYMSEPELGSRQRVLEIETNTLVGAFQVEGQFFPFPNAD